jgi:hypothetical protein
MIPPERKFGEAPKPMQYDAAVYADMDGQIVVQFKLNEKDTKIYFDSDEIKEMSHLFRTYNILIIDTATGRNRFEMNNEQKTTFLRALAHAYSLN